MSENNDRENENKNKLSEEEIIAQKKIKYMGDLYLDSRFVGYYLDEPDKPILTDYLGEVENTYKCILKGQESNHKYVGLQEGNKCFGSNVLPNNLKQISRIKNEKIKQNILGKIGDFNYNQIYSTSENQNIINEKPNDIFDKYKKINNELYQINDDISPNSFVQEKPINPYSLVLWLIVIVIIIFLIIEYINKKTANITVINI
jgi:hypothetical protein